MFDIDSKEMSIGDRHNLMIIQNLKSILKQTPQHCNVKLIHKIELKFIANVFEFQRRFTRFPLPAYVH